jgi:hypothetical protein
MLGGNLDVMIYFLPVVQRLPENVMRHGLHLLPLPCLLLAPMFGEIHFSMRSLQPHYSFQSLYKLHLLRQGHLLLSRLQPPPQLRSQAYRLGYLSHLQPALKPIVLLSDNLRMLLHNYQA